MPDFSNPPMSPRKQTQEANRTRQRIGRWLDRHPEGPEHFSCILSVAVKDAASILKVPTNVIGASLTEPPFSNQVTPFCYEESLLKPWQDETNRPIDDFIAKQGRRERPLGRRFLKSLAQSTPRVWQIVKVKPGRSVAVRRFREEPTPTDKEHVVYDESASKSLRPGDVVFARILTMPMGNLFAASVLSISQIDAWALLKLAQEDRLHASFVAWIVGVMRSHIGRDFSHISTTSTHPINTNANLNSYINSVSSTAETAFADSAKNNQQSNNATGFGDNQRQSDQHDTESNRGSGHASGQESPHRNSPHGLDDREKLFARIRKLFAMAQETEASPHEAEIALRRCQKLMAKYGIQEADLHTSQFSSETFRAGNRVPMHVKWLAMAVEELHSVLFVTGCPSGPEFRGYDIDVKVARLTMTYLEDAIERSLTSRKQRGTFPAGRSAAYDYRVAFAMEVNQRVGQLVAQRKAAEVAASGNGTALTIKKMEIVERECAHDLVTTSARYRGARPGEAADAGRVDGSNVSLDPQVNTRQRGLLATES